MCWIWVYEIQIQAKQHVLDPADRMTSTTEHDLGQNRSPLNDLAIRVGSGHSYA